MVFLEGGFVVFVVLFEVIDEAVCYRETAREFDLTVVFSLTHIDCIHLGSHFTTLGLGWG